MFLPSLAVCLLAELLAGCGQIAMKSFGEVLLATNHLLFVLFLIQKFLTEFLAWKPTVKVLFTGSAALAEVCCFGLFLWILSLHSLYYRKVEG